MRSREIVILDDASAHPTFSTDSYIRERNARSILCLPLVNESKMTGVLYLENNLTAYVFTPDRIAILKLLALQAAISLENTYLYGDLAEREAKIRRLVDANIIGIFIADLDGRIIDANDAFLQVVGYDRDDLTRGILRLTELTPAEWRGANEQAVTELNATGVFQPYEMEYLRKDGSRVQVLIGGAIFDGVRDQGVAFVLDLSHRKRAEEAARESEKRCQEVQLELAHASRVATMGQLTASIAHEINHPIGAALINAETALRWLARQPPDMQRARQALDRIVKDGKRAADIIGRIRELVKKAPAQKGNLEINEAILEVIGLTRSEMSKNGVHLQTQLAEGLPVIQGDRVQLQQVILNLIINAIEAMAKMSEGRRELLISTEPEPDGVCVALRDSGPGLPQADFDRAFEAFYTTKPGGLGMGLSICRSIVDSHGGRLWTMPNPPRGAAFCFTLSVEGPK
jgi:PAS domain S-box-containing protein